MLVNTCGFVEAAKKDSVDALLEAADLKGRAAHPGGGGGRLPGRAVRRGAGRLAARGRRRARLRRLPRHRRPAARDPRGGAQPAAHPAGPAAAAARSRPASRADAELAVPGHADARRPPGTGSRPGRWRRSSWPRGCDRRCSFCAIPQLPRLLRQPASLRRAGRGPLAGRPGRARAVPGQRELHLLRQGPRRPAAAGDAAARAGRHRRRSTGCGSPTSSPPRPGRGWSRRSRRPPAWRRTSTCPSSTPAPAVLRRMRRFGDPESFLGLLEQVRALAPEAGVRSNVIVGLPRGDRAGPRRCCATSWSPRGSTSPACSATPTRTAPRPPTFDGKLDEDEIRARTAHVTDLVEELTSQRAEERVGEEVRGAGRIGRRGAVRGPSGPPGPRGRRHHDPARRGGSRVGDLVPRQGRRHRRRRPDRPTDRSTVDDRVRQTP